MAGAKKDWYVHLDCEDDKKGISSPSSGNDAMIPLLDCGIDAETACCNLQAVLNNLHEGDTVYINQVANYSRCNRTEDIEQIGVKELLQLNTSMIQHT